MLFGVDLYYFNYETHEIEKLGYHSQMITNDRMINDKTKNYAEEAILKQMILTKLSSKSGKVVILCHIFKKNHPDTRNSKIIYFFNKKLKKYDIFSIVIHPWESPKEAKREYKIEIAPMKEAMNSDYVILTVTCNQFKELIWKQIDGYVQV